MKILKKISHWFSKIYCWFFSINKVKKEDDKINILSNKMTTTARCRYIACKRLQSQGSIAFITTTVLSLGLIFIPLMQMTTVKLKFDSSILNAIQIFLAVSVLVYSVVIGTARYDFRSEKLNECADKIQDLILRLNDIKGKKNDELEEKFTQINDEYGEISVISENHSNNDYLLSALRTSDKYTGLIRLFKWGQYYIFSIKNYLIPIILFLFEILFISDMFGVTKIFYLYLSNGQ